MPITLSLLLKIEGVIVVDSEPLIAVTIIDLVK
jgi:hypothetical protein